MRAGRLRHRITFKKQGTGRDKFGQPIPAPETIATVWAQVRPAGSNERLAAAQMQSALTHVVTVRYSETLAAATGDWWIEHRSRTLAINGLPRNHDEKDRFLTFDCIEGTGA